ncbi:cloacin, partial [Salmonella enterica subsp. enterica]|nr:cloacin [Salmonella enterica subsp. enterica]EIR6872386.1 cloacin [Salmonella enterica]
SQYGELEGDRASDGEHPGAFDPKTGKQVKAPDSKRILAILSIPFFTDVFNQNFP